nr:hypothetical protein TetV2_00495 [Oceanusvirus sp.]
MCFSEQSSWLSLIVGTAVNVVSANIPIVKRNPLILSVLAWGQFGLLMQVVDALAWRSIREGWSDEIRSYLSKIAFILNVLQPVVLLLFFNAAKPGNDRFPIVFALVAVYTAVMLFNAVSSARVSMFPGEQPIGNSCPHMVYNWWLFHGKPKPPKSTSVATWIHTALYALVILVVFSAYMSPFSILPLYFLGGMMLSLMMYRCGQASLWCWSVASAGLAAYAHAAVA